jgi:hypothetical protein
MSAESQLCSRVRERGRLNKKLCEWKRVSKKFDQWDRIRKKFDEFDRALEAFVESFDQCLTGARGRGQAPGCLRHKRSWDGDTVSFERGSGGTEP